MKFVDEFRDPELGRALAGEILSMVEPGRHYKLMEVCGGHTHSIYKYGVDDLLPENVELVHGPGCPVCVIPMGRVDDGLAIARRENVIFTCFGDMMRVPGSEQTFLDAKAEGADIRMVYSPLDALRIAKANPDRDVVFFAIGFETTAPSTALTLKRAKQEGIENFLCICNHVTIVPPLRALLESPDLRLDGFIGPGHVSTIVGARPFEFIPADYGKPLVTSGFEPLDILQGIEMILAQIAAGEAKVENQYARVVPYEGNLAALTVMSEVFAIRPHFEWRGLGFISQSGLRLSDEYADFDAELKYDTPGVRVADPKACQCGEVLKGVIKPWECKVFGTACTPEHAIGTCMVSPEGACAAYYQYGRFAREREVGLMAAPPLESSAPVSDRERKILGIIENTRAKRPRFKAEQVTMAHGAGGKSTQTMIEGLFVPAFAGDDDPGGLGALADAGTVSVDGTGLAMTTDSFVVKPIRFPGGSIGELAVNGTVNDLAMAGARPLAMTLALILEEGLRAEELRAEVEAIARAATAAGVEIVSGDTKVVERGCCDSMYVTTTGVGVIDPRAALAPANLRPGDRVLVSGPIGEHGTAIMLARDEFELDADIESDTAAALAGRRRPARRRRRRTALHARRDSRWCRHRPQRARPGLGRGDRRPRG